METKKEGSKIPGILSAIGTFMKGIKDYNIFELMKVLFAGACVAFMIVLVTKPEVIFEQIGSIAQSIDEAKTERHNEGATYRLKADENIRGELTGLLEATGASRAFVMELHNGSSNLSSGLPFIYLDLTLDVYPPGEQPLRDGEFKDLRTAQYPLISLLLEQGYWYGTIDEVQQIDPRLSYYLMGHNVNELAVMTLWNGQSATGFLCLTWHGAARMDKLVTGKEIRASGTKIAVELALLDRLIV